MRCVLRAAALIACVALVQSAAGAQGATALAIDAAHSRARFTVTHLYLAHVSGTVPIVAGTIALAGSGALPARITATLDPRRVDSGNADRDEDLQGPDWFDTAKFPVWTFASTAVRGGSSGGTFVVDGILTVHGVTQPVALTVTPGGSSARPSYHAVGKLDRHGFGMRTTPIDGLIGTDVELTLDVETQSR